MKTARYPIPYIEPHLIFAHFAKDAYALFLDHSKPSDEENISIIAFDPIETYTFKAEHPTNAPIEKLQNLLNKYTPEKICNANHFTSGLAGLFSYDLGRTTEQLPSSAKDELNLPDIVVGIYLKTIAFNQTTKEAYLYITSNSMADAKQEHIKILTRLKDTAPSTYKPISLNWIPDKDKDAYKASIAKVIDYIHQGDIFQACIAQRFTAKLPHDFDSYAHYQHLRSISPAPFSCYMNTGDAIISSNSPERFLKLDPSGHVETCPIKGTAPIDTDPQDLLSSEKDRAENTMIVDLMRNDLSRTCEPHSIDVPELCALKSFANVHHLISKVTATLKKGNTPLDLLRTCFPGGSISGAPKIRAMEIIDEIEPVRRNAYCGSIGYIGFNGQMDMNILIRTLIFKGDTAHLYSGGGIVADSTPEQEYQETLSKAQKLFESLNVA